ncbi:cytoskeleton-associated protein 2 [Ascaphus truei]|uniref:cytoskeleton-associated protein 2 n=1 Tax=Ascaphus truei TaxID=8439 RepID=UPI003F59ACAF
MAERYSNTRLGRLSKGFAPCRRDRMNLVQPLPPSRRLLPSYREQRRKNIEAHLSRKMSFTGPHLQDKKLEKRSPLTETVNQAEPQDKVEILKPVKQKMVTKENIAPQSVTSKGGSVCLQKPSDMANPITNIVVKRNPDNSKALVKPNTQRESQQMSFTRSFLKTKVLKEKQLKDEELKQKATDLPKKPVNKPVLGAYRGKVIPSKINSFRKAPESNDIKKRKQQVPAPKPATQSKTLNVAAGKQVSKSASAGALKQRAPPVPETRPRTRPSTSAVIKNREEPATTRRHTHALVIKSMGENVLHKPGPDKNKKPTESVGQKAEMLHKRRTLAGPVSTRPGTTLNKTAQQPAAGSKYTRPKESAEERKARLAEWKALNGKVMKRPPVSAQVSSTCKGLKQEPKIKNEPEEQTPPLFWATMAEEDEQEIFTVQVNKMFSDCLKLIEVCPKEAVLNILEKQIQSVPEAKKLSKYWVCLARLEQRHGRLDKVISICEEAVAAGAQPLDELRNILADAVENLKTAPSDSGKNLEHAILYGGKSAKVEKIEAVVKSECLMPEVEDVKVKREKEGKLGGTEKDKKLRWKIIEEPPKELLSPDNGGDASTLIKFNVRTTPYLQSIKKKMQFQDSDSTIRDLKFLTPVRRSRRIELKTQQLPDMLKDHDPCVSSLAQLGEVGSPSDAYIYRQNDALQDVTVNNIRKQ